MIRNAKSTVDPASQEAIEHFNALVTENMAKRQCTRQEAVLAISRRHPRAHAAFLKATNLNSSVLR